jgi:hypothetical protein
VGFSDLRREALSLVPVVPKGRLEGVRCLIHLGRPEGTLVLQRPAID